MGLSKRTDDLKTLGLGRVHIHGAFRPNGAGGIVSGSQKGKGWSVARTSAGLYTVTFDDKYPAMVDCKAWARVADATPTIVQGGDYVAASKTMQIRVLQGTAGGVTEGTGFINIPISAAMEIEANDIPAMSDTEATATINAHGDLARNSTPILQRANVGTDQQLRIHWAAADVAEITFPNVIIPPDIKVNTDMVVHAIFGASGHVDPGKTVACHMFYNAASGAYAADAEVAANFTLADNENYQELTVTLASADIGGATPHPGFLNLSLLPAAHAADAVYLYGLWIEYTLADWATTGQIFSLTDLAADVDNEILFNAIFRNTSVNY